MATNLIPENPIDLYKDAPYDADTMGKTEVDEVLEQSNREEYESLSIAGLMDKHYYDVEFNTPSKSKLGNSS